MASKDDEELKKTIEKIRKALTNASDELSSPFLDLSKTLKNKNKEFNEIADNFNANSKKVNSVLNHLEKSFREIADNAKITNSQIDNELKKQISILIKHTETLSSEQEKLFKDAFSNIDNVEDFRIACKKAAETISELDELQQDYGSSTEEISKNLQKFGLSIDEITNITKEFEDKYTQAREKEIKELHESIERKRQAGEFEFDLKQELLEKEEEIFKKYDSQKQNVQIDFIKTHNGLKNRFNEMREVLMLLIKTSNQFNQNIRNQSDKSFQPFLKYIDDSGKSIVKRITDFATLGTSIALLVKAITTGYQQFVKINSLGLAGTFENLETKATAYGFSVEALTQLSDDNKVTIARNSILDNKHYVDAQSDFIDFTKNIADQDAIKMYGRDEGLKAAGRATKLLGFSGLTMKTGKSGEDVAKKLLKTQTQLTTLTGETSEEYFNNIDTLKNMDEIQAKLSNATEEQRKAILLNTAAQYAQLRVNGLSTEQAKQRIQLEQERKNALKGDWLSKLKGELIGPQILGIMANQLGKKLNLKGVQDVIQITGSQKAQLEETAKGTGPEAEAAKKRLAGMQEVKEQITDIVNSAKDMPALYQAMINTLSKNEAFGNINELVENIAQEVNAKRLGKGITGTTKDQEKAAKEASSAPIKQEFQSLKEYLTNSLSTPMGTLAASILALGATITGAGTLLATSIGALAAAIASGNLGGLGKLGKLGALARMGPHAAILAAGAVAIPTAYAAGKKSAEFGVDLTPGIDSPETYRFKKRKNEDFTEQDEFLKKKRLELEKRTGKPYAQLLKEDKEKTGLVASATVPQAKQIDKTSSEYGISNPIGKVLETGSGFIKIQRPDGVVQELRGDRNWRNNNPGNIEAGEFANSHGAIGSDGRFAIFPTYEIGDKARSELLKNGKRYVGKNLSDQIAIYAPPSDNNTAQYQSNVLASVGGKNIPFADYSPAEQQAILDAMKKQEGYKQGTIKTLPSTMTAQTLLSPFSAAQIDPTKIATGSNNVSASTINIPSSVNSNDKFSDFDSVMSKKADETNSILTQILRAVTSPSSSITPNRNVRVGIQSESLR